MCGNLDLNISSSHCLAKTSGQDVYSQTKVNGPSCLHLFCQQHMTRRQFF